MKQAVLTADLAARFAVTAIHNIRQTLPQRVDAVQVSDRPIPAPRVAHPAFHGSFDWHSCVHMHWLLVRLLQLFPGQPWQEAARQSLTQRLCRQNLEVEFAFFERPENRLFERPYGWAWLLKLFAAARELQVSEPGAAQWTDALGPMAALLASRLEQYLSLLAYPVRAGTHGNTAFAMMLALDFAEPGLAAKIRERAMDWFGADRNYPASYEPDGEDFLSGGLTEAALMSRLLAPEHFALWWSAFCPERTAWSRWQQAVQPSSRTDGRLVHLAGLNLSRAWCMRLIAARLPSADEMLEAAAQNHLQASLPHVTGGDFAAHHWLASFATLALAP